MDFFLLHLILIKNKGEKSGEERQLQFSTNQSLIIL